MAKKLGLLAIVAAIMAYAPVAAFGCSGSSAQLSGGPQVAQGYGSSSSSQPMPEQSGSSMTDQSGGGTSDSNSPNDK